MKVERAGEVDHEREVGSQSGDGTRDGDLSAYGLDRQLDAGHDAGLRRPWACGNDDRGRLDGAGNGRDLLYAAGDYGTILAGP